MLARIRKSMEEKDQGFTLVELLVVMIIIGVLASIAIPVFLNQRKRAVDTSIKSDLRTVAQEVETAYVDAQNYPVGSSAGTWTTATDATVAPGAKVSGTNTIEYKSITGGYCVRGSNAKATADGTTTGSKYFIYDSKGGGLQAAKADSTSYCS